MSNEKRSQSPVSSPQQATSAQSSSGFARARPTMGGARGAFTSRAQSPKQTVSDKIKQELAEDKWGIEVMAVAMAAKNELRAKKGTAFNGVVLDQSKTVYTKSNNADQQKNEVREFFTKLRANMANIENGTRFQLAVRVGEYYADESDKNERDTMHWVACDLMIKDGKLMMFVMDSADDHRANKLISDMQAEFGITVYRYADGELRYMQKDNESCSRFTLDNLYRLSLMQIYDDVDKLVAEGKIPKTPDNPNVIDINPENCPESMAVLYRNVQSFKILETFQDRLKQTVINQRGETLPEYIKRHTEPDQREKKHNRGIQHKKESFAQQIEAYMSDTSHDLEKVLATRQGFALVESSEHRTHKRESEPALYDPLKAATFLINREKQHLSNYVRNHNDDTALRDLQILTQMSNLLKGSKNPAEALLVLKEGVTKIHNQTLAGHIHSLIEKFPQNLSSASNTTQSVPENQQLSAPSSDVEQLTAPRARPH